MLARRTPSPSPRVATGAAPHGRAPPARSRGSLELMNKLKAMDAALEHISDADNERQLVPIDAKENIVPGSSTMVAKFQKGDAALVNADQSEKHFSDEDSLCRELSEEQASLRKKYESLRSEFELRTDELQRRHGDTERRWCSQHEAHRTEVADQLGTLCSTVEAQRGHIQQLLELAKDLSNRIEPIEAQVEGANRLRETTDSCVGRLTAAEATLVALTRQCENTAVTAKAETQECGEIMQKMTKQMASFRQQLKKAEQHAQEQLENMSSDMKKHIAEVTEAAEGRSLTRAVGSMEERIHNLQEQGMQERLAMRQQMQQLDCGPEQSYIKGALKEVQSAVRRWPEKADEAAKQWEATAERLRTTIDDNGAEVRAEAARLAAATRDECTELCDYEAGERSRWIEHIEEQEELLQDGLRKLESRLEEFGKKADERCLGVLHEVRAVIAEQLATVEAAAPATHDQDVLGSLQARLEEIPKEFQATNLEIHGMREECQSVVARFEDTLANHAAMEQHLMQRVGELEERWPGGGEVALQRRVETALEAGGAVMRKAIDDRLNSMSGTLARSEGALSRLDAMDERLHSISCAVASSEAIEDKLNQRATVLAKQFEEHSEAQMSRNQEAHLAREAEMRAESLAALEGHRHELMEALRDHHPKPTSTALLEVPRGESLQSQQESVVERTEWRQLSRRTDAVERRLQDIVCEKSLTAEVAADLRVAERHATLERTVKEMISSQALDVSTQLRAVERSLKELIASQAEDNAAAFRSVMTFVLEQKSGTAPKSPLPQLNVSELSADLYSGDSRRS